MTKFKIFANYHLDTKKELLDVDSIKTNWVTPSLLNGWKDYSDVFSSIQYCKKSNVVYLKGLATGGIGIGDTKPIFILPVGFRPLAVSIFSVHSATGTASSIRITPGGSVYVDAGSTSWTSLDGIAFCI